MGAVCIPLMYITNFLHISQNTGTGEQNQYAPVICMMSRSRIGLIAPEWVKLGNSYPMGRCVVLRNKHLKGTTGIDCIHLQWVPAAPIRYGHHNALSIANIELQIRDYIKTTQYICMDHLLYSKTLRFQKFVRCEDGTWNSFLYRLVSEFLNDAWNGVVSERWDAIKEANRICDLLSV